MNIEISADEIWEAIENNEKFRQEIDKRIEQGVQAAFKKLNYSEPYILGDEAAALLGCSLSTLASYRGQGMPYIKSSPNKYRKSEILAWQVENKNIYRKVCQR